MPCGERGLNDVVLLCLRTTRELENTTGAFGPRFHFLQAVSAIIGLLAEALIGQGPQKIGEMQFAE